MTDLLKRERARARARDDDDDDDNDDDEENNDVDDGDDGDDDDLCFKLMPGRDRVLKANILELCFQWAGVPSAPVHHNVIAPNLCKEFHVHVFKP